MSTIIIILIVVATVKFFLFGGILWAVFKDEIRGWLRKPEPSWEPVCMYCGSVYTRQVDEGQMRWEDDHFVLVTMYECDHCDLPFWHVERISTGGSPSRPRERGKI